MQEIEDRIIMKYFLKSLLLVSLAFNVPVSYGQTDSLGMASEREKASAVSVLYTFEEFLSNYAANKPEEECKQAALKLIKEGLYNAQIMLPNDLDTAKKQLPVIEYANRLRSVSAGKWTIKVSNFRLNQLAYDKLRRKHFLIVKADKITIAESVEEGTGDTLVEEKVQPLLFYFRFNKIQNVFFSF